MGTPKKVRQCRTCRIVHDMASWTLQETDLPDFRNKCIYALNRNADQVTACTYNQVKPPEPCASCGLGLFGKDRCPEITKTPTCPEQNYIDYTRRTSLNPYP